MERLHSFPEWKASVWWSWVSDTHSLTWESDPLAIVLSSPKFYVYGL